MAGNETTRNAIAHGLHALSTNPDQRDRWRADYEASCRPRWRRSSAGPPRCIHFRRTVTRDDVRLGDHVFREGEKVVLWYNSADRDEAEFVDPQRFDVGRTPNDHVGFGGPGPALLPGRPPRPPRDRGDLPRAVPPDARHPSVGEPDRLRSNFINGIKHLPATFTPA